MIGQLILTLGFIYGQFDTPTPTKTPTPFGINLTQTAVPTGQSNCPVQCVEPNETTIEYIRNCPGCLCKDPTKTSVFTTPTPEPGAHYFTVNNIVTTDKSVSVNPNNAALCGLRATRKGTVLKIPYTGLSNQVILRGGIRGTGTYEIYWYTNYIEGIKKYFFVGQEEAWDWWVNSDNAVDYREGFFKEKDENTYFANAYDGGVNRPNYQGQIICYGQENATPTPAPTVAPTTVPTPEWYVFDSKNVSYKPVTPNVWGNIILDWGVLSKRVHVRFWRERHQSGDTYMRRLLYGTNYSVWTNTSNDDVDRWYCTYNPVHGNSSMCDDAIAALGIGTNFIKSQTGVNTNGYNGWESGYQSYSAYQTYGNVYYGYVDEYLITYGINPNSNPPTPTPTQTPTRVYTPTTEPENSSICSSPPGLAPKAVGFEFNQTELITFSGCQVIVPEISFSVPGIEDFVEGFDVYIPSIQVCKYAVDFPELEVLNYRIPVEYPILIAVVAFLIRMFFLV